MSRADDRMTKRESLPVVDEDGRLLGSCTVCKFTRKPGKAYNEITLHDLQERVIARILGYRLHSHVFSGDCEGNAKRIDSKDALVVARIALEHGPQPAHVLEAIQEIAEILFEQRAPKPRGREPRR